MFRKVRRVMGRYWLMVGLVGCSSGEPSPTESLGTQTAAIDQNAAIVIRQLIYPRPNTRCGSIEVLNRSAAPASLNGLSIQNLRQSRKKTFPNVTLQPGQSYLFGFDCGSASTAGYDLIETLSGYVSRGDVSIALVRGTNFLGCGESTTCTATQLANIVDLIGFTGSLLSEGNAFPLSMNANEFTVRKNYGKQDTNDNKADFEVATIGPPYPMRNFASCYAAQDDGDACTIDGCDLVSGIATHPTLGNPLSAAVLDPTAISKFVAQIQPLYSGSGRSQTPYSANELKAKTVSVLRGRVLTETGSAKSCASVRVVEQPNVGSTITDSSGYFTIAINGGAPATVRIESAGFITVDRQVTVGWNQYAKVPDARMLPFGTSTAVNSASQAITVASGASETDANGTRRARLLVKPGTTAFVAGEASPRTTYNVQIKEVTNRTTHQRDGMPASLPNVSAFTYAVELSVQGAENKAVTFNNPTPFYVENFLDFPNGEDVPVGYYDTQARRWVASSNGRVIRIKAIVGGVADVDTDADPNDTDDPSAELGMDLAERTQLAQLYAPLPAGGKKLWRFTTNHFSTWDANWGWGPPSDAKPPHEPPPRDPPPPPPDETCAGGSVVGCETQTLREHIPLAGTDMALWYSSANQPGGQRPLRIPVVTSLPNGLKSIQLEITVAGRVFSPTIAVPTASQLPRFYDFAWDGTDVAGRQLYGSQPVHVRIGYTYDGSYQRTTKFGTPGDGTIISASKDRFEATLWQEQDAIFELADAAAVGLGGWTLSDHHRFDGKSGTIHLGTGVVERPLSVMSSVIGTGTDGLGGENIVAANSPASLTVDSRVVVAADGSIYFSEPTRKRVRRVSPDGYVSTAVGGGSASMAAPYGDGGPATQAYLTPKGLALGTDGTLYVADTEHRLVRAVSPQGIISTVVGNPSSSTPYDAQVDQPATGINLLIGGHGAVDLGVSADGSLFATTEDGNICRLKDGIWSTRVKEVWGYGTLGVSASGFLYATDGYGRVQGFPPNYKSPSSPVIIAGDGGAAYEAPWGDGGSAPISWLSLPSGLTVDANGALLIADSGHGVIRRVDSTGTIDTAFGVPLEVPTAVAVASDGRAYIIDGQRIFGRSPRAEDGGSLTYLTSADGLRIYSFDPQGRHLATYDRRTGILKRAFRYDAKGYLTGVSDRALTDSGRHELVIQRDAQEVATGIVAPHADITTGLTVVDGTLTGVAAPDGGSYTFDYTSGGLLRHLYDPEINAQSSTPYEFTFAGGRLTNDKDPYGHAQSLQASNQGNGFRVTHTDQLGRTKTADTTFPDLGGVTRVLTGKDQVAITIKHQFDGTFPYRAPSGAVFDSYMDNGAGTKIYSRTDQNAASSLPTQTVDRELRYEGSGPVRDLATTKTVVLATLGVPVSISSYTETTVANSHPARTVAYDATTRTFTTTSPEARKVTQVVDSYGRPTSLKVDGIAATTTISYGATSGLIESISSSDGTTTRKLEVTERADGYPTEIHALLNGVLKQARKFGRDKFGRRQSISDGVVNSGTGSVSSFAQLGGFSFDKNGNLNGSTTPQGHVLKHNLLNLLSEYQSPALAGQPATSTANTTFSFKDDRQADTDTLPDAARSTSRSYDSAGRLSGVTFGSKSIAFTYFASGQSSAGKLKTVNGPYGVNLALVYEGSLPTSQTWSGSVVGSFTQSYDNDFFANSETVAGKTGTATYKRGYDHDKLLTCLSPSTCSPAGTDAQSIVRDTKSGLITKITVGKVQEDYTYNAFGELASKTITGNALPLLQLTYDAAGAGRDVLGRVTRFTEKVGAAAATSLDYKYDASNALTDVLLGASVREQYTYAVGGTHNRTSAITPSGTVSTIVVDTRDRLTQYGNLTFDYWDNGDLKTRTNATTSVVTTYDYDTLGNLKSVTTPNLTVTYLLDGRGRRVWKKAGSTTKQWLYRDGVHPVAELDAAGALVSTFVYGSRDDVPDLMIRGGKTYRLVTDQLGSVRMVVNVADPTDVPFKASYGAFGETTITVVAPATKDFVPFGFAGGMYDADTGLVHFGARDYDPVIGRWLSKDPILFAGGQFNLYAYLNSDPINRRDPLGLCGGKVPPEDIAELKASKDAETTACGEITHSGSGNGPLPLGSSSTDDETRKKIDECAKARKQYADDEEEFTKEESSPFGWVEDIWDWFFD